MSDYEGKLEWLERDIEHSLAEFDNKMSRTRFVFSLRKITIFLISFAIISSLIFLISNLTFMDAPLDRPQKFLTLFAVLWILLCMLVPLGLYASASQLRIQADDLTEEAEHISEMIEKVL